MKNIFEPQVTEEIIKRINKLSPNSRSIWGKMSVAQMLAHCNVTYEMIFETIHKKPNPFVKFLLKAFVKNKVVSDTAYKQNGPTAPQFIIKEDKDFTLEKKRLIDYIIKTQQLGEEYFHNKESLSFGALTKREWNNMFYKHLNHHLSQFGV
jgi:hypothetical protein